MNRIAKAIAAGATALAGGVATAQADGNITATEWAIVAVAVVVAVIAVWATPPKSKKKKQTPKAQGAGKFTKVVRSQAEFDF